MALFRNPGNGTYWASRSMAVFELAESAVQTLTAPATDWYGLVIFANEWPGSGSYWVRVLRTDAVTGIGPGEASRGFALHENVPNPFNPETEIRYALPHDGPVDLDVFDVSGRHVRSLVRGPRAGGEQRVRWDGRDDAGGEVASGVYVLRLVMDGRVATRKVVLLK
jgi:hypothetical protein